MVSALRVHEGKCRVKSYPVHVTLIVESPDPQSALDTVDLLMEALADADESDDTIQDWTVGFASEEAALEIDLTVAAQHHADALAHGHDVVRGAVEAAQSGAPHQHPVTILDSDSEIKVFA